jgi:arylsulfatase A-like enzyme
MIFNEKTNSAPFRPGQAAVWCLIPGPLLYFLDQAMTWLSLSKPLPLLFLLVYTVILGGVGLGGVGISILLIRFRGRLRAWRLMNGAGGLYLILLLIALVYRAFSEGVSWKAIAAVCFGLVIFGAGRLWSGSDVLRGWRAAAQALGLAALFVGFAIYPPGFGDRAGVWVNNIANAVFMALLIGMILQIRAGWPYWAGLDAVALTVLLLLGFGSHFFMTSLASHELNPEASARKSSERPNIIFIVWDTVRRDHLSLYGYERPTTPYLERLAPESMVYTHAVSVAPWTLPSHVSMMTGLYPREHGSHNILSPDGDPEEWNYRRLSSRFTTLAEILSRHGYRSGAVSANLLYVSRNMNLDRGFEYFNDQSSAMSLLYCHFNLALFLADRLKNHAPESLLYRYFTIYPTAEEVDKKALRWIDSVKDGGGPFFLFLNFMDAHGPAYPPRDLIHKFPGFNHDLLFLRDTTDRFNEEESAVSLLTWRTHLVSQYDAEILMLDKQLEHFTEQLRTRGLFDHTIIILTSDHGDHFGDHGGILGHRFDPYNEVSDIPLLIRYPGGSPRGIEPVIIENRSLFFLIQQMAGIKVEVPKEPWEACDEAFGQNPGFPRPPQTGPDTIAYHRAFFFKNYKVIVSNLDPPELYDLDQDPRETVNLADQKPAVLEQGLKLADRFMREVPRFKDEENAAENISAEQRRLMKSLGYVK